jgi:hypothetical protein
MASNEIEQVGCLGYLRQLIEQLLPSASKDREPQPYRLREDFLSPTELSYYQILNSVLGSKAAVCAKVRLADLLYVMRGEKRRSHLNRIISKHIDFLICEVSTMKPVLAIELDDSSHGKKRRKARDEFLNQAMDASGLPLLRVKAQRQYSRQQVVEQLKPFLMKSESAQKEPTNAMAEPSRSAHTEELTAQPPSCPKCRIPMVLREAKRGKNKGRRFYGCANFPQCREGLPYSPGEG